MSTARATKSQEYYILKEMESTRLQRSRSNDHNLDSLGFEERRRPLIAAAEAVTDGGLLTQRIRMSVMVNLKGFKG